MKLNKIPVPQETCLVEIVSEDNASNHAVYFLNIDGELIDHVIVREATVSEVVSLIPHMFKIHFTPMQMWEMQCATMFNRIFEPDLIPYDSIFAWQMDSELVAIIRHFGKIKNVLNYLETEEFRSEAHIVDDFISARPTPIEQESEEVHRRGIVARNKMLKIIQEWVI
ncbi:MAG: hypothetical protein IJH65_13810 [Methanobrevibacter sp.]|nr:hypothetical protein [Methanobrevibacter sp.]